MFSFEIRLEDNTPVEFYKSSLPPQKGELLKVASYIEDKYVTRIYTVTKIMHEIYNSIQNDLHSQEFTIVYVRNNET